MSATKNFGSQCYSGIVGAANTAVAWTHFRSTTSNSVVIRVGARKKT